jgi:hypothetical protein
MSPFFQAEKFYYLNEQVAEAAALANLERQDGLCKC